MDLASKKILVTGACGFIGSHLVEALQQAAGHVRALVFYNSFNSLGWLDKLDKKVLNNTEVVTGDIRDPHAMESVVQGVDIVFHLAALIAIPYSYLAPAGYVETNVNGTLNILQAARKANVDKILVTSTSEVYGTALEVPISEHHPRQAQSPYSASKIAADAMTEAFHRSFGLPATIVRPFNTYGPRQSARAVIPTIITQLLGGSQSVKIGALHPTRDLLFVKDTVRAFLAIAASDATVGEEINIATGSEISIGEIAHTLIEMINPAARIETDGARLRPEKSEVERLLGSAQKLTSLTGWTPSCTLKEGLAETVEWFSKPTNLAFYKHNQYQI